ncbi:hypothetical protein PDESU_02956 [Pontiella desulfatans]|uniref:HEAT repeat domain-containing protein n=1 Tax=Pontiella desulfatans TaxID=2750659 RepID=A0A6C2U3F5_PONDE|nr:hypothetical protein [Pontiella desulfatans]VGO14395.1 hypothetical protein PDESU_02956 [Pontiella desulfatans]
MRFVKPVIITLALIQSISSYADNFTNATHAMEVYLTRGTDFNTVLKASRFMKENPEEVIDPLLEIVKTKGYKWQSCGSILAQTKNEKVLFAYIELLSDNLYEKEEDGSRKQSPPRGVSYGRQIAEYLGKMEDKRALPVLKKAVEQGDSSVSRSALEALYYLNDVSMDDLFEMASKEKYRSTPHVILSIAFNDCRRNPTYFLTVLDRYIESFPDWRMGVGIAHMYKMESYRKLERYKDALKEADIALSIDEMFLHFDHINKRKKRILDEMKKGSKSGKRE